MPRRPGRITVTNIAADQLQSGLEAFIVAGGDVSNVHSVASFFVSRVDTEVDRTIDTDIDKADETTRCLATLGVDMDDVGRTLENQGVASFHSSFQDVLAALQTEAGQLPGP